MPINQELLQLATERVKSADAKGRHKDQPEKPPNLGPSQGAAARCATCKHFQGTILDSTCVKYKYPVSPFQVCDSYEPQEFTPPEIPEPALGDMSPLVSSMDMSPGVPQVPKMAAVKEAVGARALRMAKFDNAQNGLPTTNLAATNKAKNIAAQLRGAIEPEHSKLNQLASGSSAPMAIKMPDKAPGGLLKGVNEDIENRLMSGRHANMPALSTSQLIRQLPSGIGDRLSYHGFRASNPSRSIRAEPGTGMYVSGYPAVSALHVDDLEPDPGQSPYLAQILTKGLRESGPSGPFHQHIGTDTRGLTRNQALKAWQRKRREAPSYNIEPHNRTQYEAVMSTPNDLLEHTGQLFKQMPTGRWQQTLGNLAEHKLQPAHVRQATPELTAKLAAVPNILARRPLEKNPIKARVSDDMRQGIAPTPIELGSDAAGGTQNVPKMARVKNYFIESSFMRDYLNKMADMLDVQAPGQFGNGSIMPQSSTSTPNPAQQMPMPQQQALTSPDPQQGQQQQQPGASSQTTSGQQIPGGYKPSPTLGIYGAQNPQLSAYGMFVPPDPNAIAAGQPKIAAVKNYLNKLAANWRDDPEREARSKALRDILDENKPMLPEPKPSVGEFVGPPAPPAPEVTKLPPETIHIPTNRPPPVVHDDHGVDLMNRMFTLPIYMLGGGLAGASIGAASGRPGGLQTGYNTGVGAGVGYSLGSAGGQLLANALPNNRPRYLGGVDALPHVGGALGALGLGYMGYRRSREEQAKAKTTAEAKKRKKTKQASIFSSVDPNDIKRTDAIRQVITNAVASNRPDSRQQILNIKNMAGEKATPKTFMQKLQPNRLHPWTSLYTDLRDDRLGTSKLAESPQTVNYGSQKPGFKNMFSDVLSMAKNLYKNYVPSESSNINALHKAYYTPPEHHSIDLAPSPERTPFSAFGNMPEYFNAQKANYDTNMPAMRAEQEAWKALYAPKPKLTPGLQKPYNYTPEYRALLKQSKHASNNALNINDTGQGLLNSKLAGCSQLAGSCTIKNGGGTMSKRSRDNTGSYLMSGREPDAKTVAAVLELQSEYCGADLLTRLDKSLGKLANAHSIYTNGGTSSVVSKSLCENDIGKGPTNGHWALSGTSKTAYLGPGGMRFDDSGKPATNSTQQSGQITQPQTAGHKHSTPPNRRNSLSGQGLYSSNYAKIMHSIKQGSMPHSLLGRATGHLKQSDIAAATSAPGSMPSSNTAINKPVATSPPKAMLPKPIAPVPPAAQPPMPSTASPMQSGAGSNSITPKLAEAPLSPMPALGSAKAQYTPPGQAKMQNWQMPINPAAINSMSGGDSIGQARNPGGFNLPSGRFNLTAAGVNIPNATTTAGAAKPAPSPMGATSAGAAKPAAPAPAIAKSGSSNKLDMFDALLAEVKNYSSKVAQSFTGPAYRHMTQLPDMNLHKGPFNLSDKYNRDMSSMGDQQNKYMEDMATQSAGHHMFNSIKQAEGGLGGFIGRGLAGAENIAGTIGRGLSNIGTDVQKGYNPQGYEEQQQRAAKQQAWNKKQEERQTRQQQQVQKDQMRDPEQRVAAGQPEPLPMPAEQPAAAATPAPAQPAPAPQPTPAPAPAQQQPAKPAPDPAMVAKWRQTGARIPFDRWQSSWNRTGQAADQAAQARQQQPGGYVSPMQRYGRAPMPAGAQPPTAGNVGVAGQPNMGMGQPPPPAPQPAASNVAGGAKPPGATPIRTKQPATGSKAPMSSAGAPKPTPGEGAI